MPCSSQDQHLKACNYAKIDLLPVVVQFAADAVTLGMYHWRMIPVEMLNEEQKELRIQDIRSLGGSGGGPQTSAEPSVVVAETDQTSASTSVTRRADPTKKSVRPSTLPESGSEKGHSDSPLSTLTSKAGSSSKRTASIASTTTPARETFDGVVMPTKTRSAAVKPQKASPARVDLSHLVFDQGDLVHPHIKVPKNLVNSDSLLSVAVICSRLSRCVIAATKWPNRCCVRPCG